MPKGTLGQLVKDDSFGFIRTEQGEHLFFHANDLQGVEFSSLRTGQEIEFEVGKGWRGRPRAVNVRPVHRKTE